MGTKASSSAHHHRRQHRDPTWIVQELGQHRPQPVGQVKVPPRRRYSVAGDRQREHRHPAGRGVRPEQLPLTSGDQTDQDHER
jgi:hypothetical protein